ncbi:MAG: hypothetical protein JWQ71_1852 [Pedosphaera sp.]|nr:hypothetical protein [Pedosphaera sp.]
MKGLLTRIFNRNKKSTTLATPPPPTPQPRGPVPTPKPPAPTPTPRPVPTGDKREELRKIDKQQWEKLDVEVKATQSKVTELTNWHAPNAATLSTQLQELQKKATDGEYQVAIGLFNGLKGTVATSHAACKKWVDQDAAYQSTLTKLTEMEIWAVAAAATLRSRMTALQGDVTNGKYEAACTALLKLKTDVETAHQTAMEKRECDAAWKLVAPIYSAAKVLPVITPAFGVLIGKMQTAFTNCSVEYTAGEYKKAKPLIAIVKSTSEAVLQAKKDNEERIKADLIKRATISSDQEKRADDRIKTLSEPEKKKVEKLLTDAGSEPEKQNLKKALACGHSLEIVTAFAAKIKGKDEKWMLDNLRITGRSTGTGVRQQFKMSCQATMIQAVKGELDPVYALKMHEDHGDVDIADEVSDTSKPFAAEQKALLETPMDPNNDPINTRYLNTANTALSTRSAKTVKTVQDLYAAATSNYERNEILKKIATNPSVTELTSFANSIKGKRASGGVAVHVTDSTSGDGRGRWAKDLLNQMKDVTGIKYETNHIDASTRNVAVDNISTELAKGRPVPLTVGGGEGETAHYVLAISTHDGPPKVLYIHDPASGTTVMRTVEQIKANNMDLPSGWRQLTAYEKPSLA